jgi:hypothetical protein
LEVDSVIVTIGERDACSLLPNAVLAGTTREAAAPDRHCGNHATSELI